MLLAAKTISFSLRCLRSAVIASASLLVFLPAHSAARAEGPFVAMAGHWSGSGTITMADGNSEPLRCRAANMVSPSGAEMRQSLRCASPSYRLDISSSAVSDGGTLSGSWAEATRGISGNISGRANGSGISANVMGGNFAARLSVRMQGNRQFVSIRPESGADVAAVSIALHRG